VVAATTSSAVTATATCLGELGGLGGATSSAAVSNATAATIAATTTARSVGDHVADVFVCRCRAGIVCELQDSAEAM
jgi:hypothetical protein